MGRKGMDNLRKVCGIEAMRYQEEGKIREHEIAALERECRKRVRKRWAALSNSGNKLDEELRAEMIERSAKDKVRYHQEMEVYTRHLQCDCARAGKCLGVKSLCLCKCLFCNTNRYHPEDRCDCCKFDLAAKKKSGSVGMSPLYRCRPSATCPCRESNSCAVTGCECFCSFCIRRKAQHIKSNRENTGKYCPCNASPVCMFEASRCPCRCYKCAGEKYLLGYCPMSLAL